jgi:hypothetical protein
LDQIVVVAPDDAFLVDVHRVRAVPACLWLVGPIGGLLELRDGDAGDLARLLERKLVRLDGGVEILGVARDEVLVVPTLFDRR